MVVITGKETDAELREARQHLCDKARETDSLLLAATLKSEIRLYRNRGDMLADEIDTIVSEMERRQLESIAALTPSTLVEFSE